jgi:hypothetical protein
MALHRDSAHRLDQLLNTVANAVQLDPEIDLLRTRLRAFQPNGGLVLDALADAVASGDDKAQPLLFAASMAEVAGTPQIAAQVVAEVKTRVQRMIRARMADHGTTVYSQVAEMFDKSAVKFIDACSTVDVEAPAEIAVGMPDRQRKLWQSAPEMARELDKLATVLHASAVLAGLTSDDHTGEIAVCVDNTGIDPNTITDCWNIRDTERKAASVAASGSPFTGQAAPIISRCGRWSGLLAAGATLRSLQPALAT